MLFLCAFGERKEEERKLSFNNLLHIHQHAFLKYMMQSVIERKESFCNGGIHVYQWILYIC